MRGVILERLVHLPDPFHAGIRDIVSHACDSIPLRGPLLATITCGLEAHTIARIPRRIVDEAVVSGLQNRDFAGAIGGARQIHFTIPGQIAQIGKLELSIGEQEAQAAAVLAFVGGLILDVLAEWIRATAINGLADHLAVGSDHRDFDSLEEFFRQA